VSVRSVESTVATVPPTRDRWAPVFWVFVVGGMLVAFVLGVREIVDRPPVRLSEVRVGDEAEVTTRVQTLARNFSSTTTYCVEVTITAVDGDGLTLAEAVAAPNQGDGRLTPGASVNMAAVLTDLTAQELDEELDEYLAFVTRREPC
jgi:hypothetical protein